MHPTPFARGVPANDRSLGPLRWDRVENRKRCSIGVETEGGYKGAPATWPATQDQMIDAMVRLETALRPPIAHLA